jgi:hypothetical protein
MNRALDIMRERRQPVSENTDEYRVHDAGYAAAIADVVAKLRAVLFAVAVLTLARSAYAQNIDITIRGDPWKVSPSEARKQYLRGREADEMIRKGYKCFRLPSGACSWEKLEDFGFSTTAKWGKCEQSRGAVKGRICERQTSYSVTQHCDFERPLVLLSEKLHDAQRAADETASGAVDSAIIKLMAVFRKKALGIFKRLTYEQRVVLDQNFGYVMDRAYQLERATDEERQSLVMSRGAVRDQIWNSLAQRVTSEDQDAEAPEAETPEERVVRKAREAREAETPMERIVRETRELRVSADQASCDRLAVGDWGRRFLSCLPEGTKEVKSVDSAVNPAPIPDAEQDQRGLTRRYK